MTWSAQQWRLALDNAGKIAGRRHLPLALDLLVDAGADEQIGEDEFIEELVEALEFQGEQRNYGVREDLQQVFREQVRPRLDWVLSLPPTGASRDWYQQLATVLVLATPIIGAAETAPALGLLTTAMLFLRAEHPRPAPSPVTPEPTLHREALEGLLLSLFSRGEFLRFARGLPGGERLLSEAVDEKQPTAGLIHEFCLGIVRRGTADARFWEKLRQERPQRAAEVSALEQVWAAVPAPP